MRQKNFDTKSWHNSLKHKIFRYPKLVTYWRFPLRNFSALWDQKNFDTKSWHNSLKHKIFGYPKLATHWRFPLPNFSELWDRHFLTDNRDTPSPLFSLNFFDTRSFVKQSRVPLRSIFGTVRQQFFYRKLWFSPLRHKVFRYPKFSETHTVCSTKFFVLWDENFSTENRDTLLHKVHKSVVELMFVRTLWKLISKQ